MKVVDKNYLVNIESYRNNGVEKKNSDQQPVKQTKAASNGDKVALSPQARQIQEARVIIDSLPDVRQDKIDELKSRIANNTYEIDAKKIAEKMIDTALNNEQLTQE
jgi:negative regulator of flagellin synthesis FlgM